jgi:SAM-dependent methyltransferase
MHTWLQAVDPQVYRQAVDEYRAHWRFLLPIGPDSQVLDLNSDWGAAAINLAECCGLVVAAEACPARARFIAVRARQMRHDNLIALQVGFDQPLPFAAASFDAVILVDAIARLATPADQRPLLRQVHTILRPGGAILLADTNRLSPAAMIDPHTSGCRHTIWGYRQLLRTAQFHSIQAHALLPSHLEPFFIVPLDHDAPFASFLETVIRSQDFAAHVRQRGRHGLYRLVRLVGASAPLEMLTRLARPFVPSIALVARA